MSKWYIARCHPGSMSKILTWMEENGIMGWAPKFVAMRRLRRVRRRKKVVEYSMPGFIFIHENSFAKASRLRPTSGMRGYRFMLFNSKMAQATDLEIDNMKMNSCEVWTAEDKGLKVGDTAEIVKGPFNGYIVTIEGWDGTHFRVVEKEKSLKIKIAPFFLEKTEVRGESSIVASA